MATQVIFFSVMYNQIVLSRIQRHIQQKEKKRKKKSFYQVCEPLRRSIYNAVSKAKKQTFYIQLSTVVGALVIAGLCT